MLYKILTQEIFFLHKYYYCLVISDYVFESTILTVIIELVLLLCSFLCVFFIYKYYGSLVETQKTLITFLMRVLMITGVYWSLNRKINKFFHLLLPDESKYFYSNHTELACNIMSSYLPSTLFISNLTMILCTKCFMMVNTMRYLSLDHDYLKRIALISFIVYHTTEKLLLYFIYGTLCPSSKLDKIRITYNVDVSNIHHLPRLYFVYVMFLGLPEAIYRIILLRKIRKERRYLLV